MTLFLASVRDVAEAEIALLAGADIVDLKDPAQGALGAVDPAYHQVHRGLGRRPRAGQRHHRRSADAARSDPRRGARARGLRCRLRQVRAVSRRRSASLLRSASSHRAGACASSSCCSPTHCPPSMPWPLRRTWGPPASCSTPPTSVRARSRPSRPPRDRVLHHRGQGTRFDGWCCRVDCRRRCAGTACASPDLLGFRGALCHGSRNASARCCGMRGHPCPDPGKPSCCRNQSREPDCPEPPLRRYARHRVASAPTECLMPMVEERRHEQAAYPPAAHHRCALRPCLRARPRARCRDRRLHAREGRDPARPLLGGHRGRAERPGDRRSDRAACSTTT